MAEPLLASLANRLVNEDKVRLADGSPAAGSQGLSGEKQLALLIAVSVKPPKCHEAWGCMGGTPILTVTWDPL